MNKLIWNFCLLIWFYVNGSFAGDGECDQPYLDLYEEVKSLVKNDKDTECLKSCEMCKSIALDDTDEASAKMQKFLRDVKKMSPDQKRNIMDCMEFFGKEALKGMEMPAQCKTNLEESNKMIRAMLGVW